MLLEDREDATESVQYLEVISKNTVSAAAINDWIEKNVQNMYIKAIEESDKYEPHIKYFLRILVFVVEEKIGYRRSLAGDVKLVRDFKVKYLIK